MQGGMKMNKNVIVAVVLGVLILIAALQAVQLFTLKGKLAGGSGSSTGVATANAPVQSSGGGSDGGAKLPPNINNLPTMVGGC